MSSQYERSAANCPNCGAPVKFLWSSAVQTTCEFCHSILVRTDVDLKKVGEVADLPPDASPIQIGTEGVYQNKNFVVVGRIIYEYEQGGWNEWHIVYNDGSSGWLADAQLEYDLSWLTNVSGKPPQPLPPNASKGQKFEWQGKQYEVTSRHQGPLQRRARANCLSNIGTNPICCSPISERRAVNLRPSTTARIRRCCFSAARSSSTICI